jgi:hypothetical protein
MVQRAKGRAKRKGIPFNLKPEDIVIPNTCPVLGIPLVRGIKIIHNGSPQLDRIIPQLGYVRGNVIVISKLANCIKQNATPDQIIQVGEYFKRLLTTR